MGYEQGSSKPAKAWHNIRRSRDSLSDDNALLLFDPDHSTVDEERLVLIGISIPLRVLVVIHCERDSGDTIRLISARRATKSERAQYDARWKQ